MNHAIAQKPRGKAVYKKSSVHVPTIGISPSTKRLMEENERIVSAYSKKGKGKSLIEVVISDK